MYGKETMVGMLDECHVRTTEQFIHDQHSSCKLTTQLLSYAADGRTGFAADFPGSLPLNNCSGNIVSTVELVCYPEANWTAVGTNVTQFVISAGFPPSEPCLVSY